MAIAQGNWSNPERSPEMRSILRDRLQQRIRDFKREHPNPPPKNNAFDQLNKTLNDQLQKAVNEAVSDKSAPTRDEIEAAAAEGKTLSIDRDSTCFADVSWTEGVVDVEFQSGHTYSHEMALDEFLDWAADESTGKHFNFVLGRDYFAPTKTKGK